MASGSTGGSPGSGEVFLPRRDPQQAHGLAQWLEPGLVERSTRARAGGLDVEGERVPSSGRPSPSPSRTSTSSAA